MAKADRIQHKMVAVLCDGVQLHRVQRFGVTSDLPQEATGELANAGVVEYIKGVPDVSITLETNEVGSNDTLSLVADRMIRKDVTAKSGIVGFSSGAPRAGLGGWAIRAASSNGTLHSVTAQDLVSCYCDFMVPVTEDNVNISRTLWVHYAALTNVSWSFDVNGYASENYQFKAGNKRWFMNDYKYARVYKFYPQCASPAAIANGVLFKTGSAFSTVPKNSTILYYCYNDKIYSGSSTNPIDGSVLVPKAGYVAAADSSNMTIHTRLGIVGISTSISGGLATASQIKTAGTDNLYVVYRLATSSGTSTFGTTWYDSTRVPGSGFSTGLPLVDSAPGYQITSLATSHGGTGRAYIKAYLINRGGPAGYATTTAAGVSLRLQTVNIDIALTSDQLLQLGQQRPYGVSRAVPVPVNVSVTAKDSDLQLFCAGASTSAAQAKTVSIEDFNGQNQLQVEVYKDIAKTKRLRTFIVDKMAITGENNDIAYAGDGTYEINFTADNIKVSAWGINVTGY